MADLGQAYVQIIPKAEGITNKIGNLITPGANKAGESAGGSIAGGIKKAIAAAGIGAAVGKFFKDSLEAGGNLQQSFGGLETIYGEAADAAKNYAKEAAAAGISANDYAEQAVSFGASLKQAFEGDTTKAVEAANTAIMDMTDNAAKMGTPIENIQTAYQGFAKQNYTMLDNLKLGYGGTKTEMERLLKDATALSGVEYNIDNLGDVYDAIHVIQEDLGLTGVAAQEAAETFSGSWGAAKAAMENFMGALSTGEGVEEAATTLVSNLGTFLTQNLFPMIGTIVKQIPGAIQAAAPVVWEGLKTMASNAIAKVKENGPQWIESAKEMIANMAKGIIEKGPSVIEAIKTAVTNAVQYLVTNLPVWAEKGAEMLRRLAKGFVEHIPDMLAALANFAEFVLQNLGDLAIALIEAGWELVKGIAQGIWDAIGPTVMPAIEAVKTAIMTPINAVKDFLTGAWEAIKTKASIVWNGIKTTATTVWNGIKTAVMTPINAVKTLLSGAWNGIKTTATTVWNGIKTAITKPIETAKATLTGIIEKIKGFFPLNLGNIFNLRIPHISLTGGVAPFGIGGKGSLPKFSVTWAAKGMVVDGASIIGIGEAGKEAAIPLEGRHMRPFAQAIAEEMPGGGGITVNLNYDASDDAQDMLRDLARGIKRYRMAGAF